MLPTIYPKAVWRPLVNHSAPGTAKRTMVVLHITQGSTAAGAIATFASSKAPHRVSSHFVIDRDGSVTQLVSLAETAWHASEVNSISVGIEHVAIADKLMATEEQYRASSALVAWLCTNLGIACDRKHVLGHNEASPADHHTLCCSGALDADEVVKRAILCLPSPK